GLALAGLLLLERRGAGHLRGPGAAPAPARGWAGALVLVGLACLAVGPGGELLGWAARHAGWRPTLSEAGDDVTRAVVVALAAGAAVAVLGVAVARIGRRLSTLGEAALLALVLLPLAAPGVLFALGEVRFWNSPHNPLAEFMYTSPALLVLAGTARF